jgi:hypothetical protein
VKRGHFIDVFILESDGHVDQTGSFNLFSRKHNPLVMLSQSRIDVGIYEYKRRTDSTIIKLFNTRNGELLHTIALPRVVLDVATNGRELYFLSGRGDDGPPVKFYPLRHQRNTDSRRPQSQERSHDEQQSNRI